MPNSSLHQQKRWRAQGPNASVRSALQPSDPSTPEAAQQQSEAAEGVEARTSMAVSVWSNRVGIAYYDPTSAELFCMESSDDALGPFRYQVFQLAKLHANPKVIYVSSKADPELLEVLRSPTDPLAGAPRSFEVRVEKNSLFIPQKARAVLESVHVTGMPLGLSSRERVHMLNSMVSLSCEQQVAAVGALLAILNKEGQLQCGNAGGEVAGLSLNGLSELSLDGYLMVDPISSAAMQIFQEESHPSAMGIGQAKEGFSVFGIMNKCVSAVGKKLLRLWFSRPIVNIDVLNDRLDGVEFFMQRPDAIKSLRDTLKKVKDAPRLLIRLQSTQSMPDLKDFMQLQASLANMLLVRDMLVHLTPEAEASAAATTQAAASLYSTPLQDQHGRPRAQPPVAPGIMFKSTNVIQEELVACHNLISSVIDINQATDGMMIAYGVSEELDRMKQTYFGLPDFLTKVVQLELERIPRELSHGLQQHLWSIVYMPQVGFMLRLEGGRLRADLGEHLPDYQFGFEGSSEDGFGYYYHTSRTRQLSARFGDMLHKISDLEISICSQLVGRLGHFGPDIKHASEAVAELDCILSLALAARELNLRRPELTRSNEIVIREGRHLLTEMLVGQFIPNDTVMLPARDRIQVVTGPNYSGKSCYAKQVALITFLAHVGSFVPAQEARIGLTDRIFTRLASRETAAVPQSTFMIDLTQVAAMLRLATERSLCIIDEFGKGTVSTDGIGLLCATLRHFAGQPRCPKIVLSTHFSEVLNPQYLPRSNFPQLSFYTMQVIVNSGSTGQENEEGPSVGAAGTGAAAAVAAALNAEDLVFLYKLAPGHAVPSFGVYCAQMGGVKQEVVARARQVIAAQTSGAAIRADMAGRLAERYGSYRGLVQRLLELNLNDGEAAGALLEEALGVAAADSQ